LTNFGQNERCFGFGTTHGSNAPHAQRKKTVRRAKNQSQALAVTALDRRRCEGWT
jgi:hypothetical protein